MLAIFNSLKNNFCHSELVSESDNDKRKYLKFFKIPICSIGKNGKNCRVKHGNDSFVFQHGGKLFNFQNRTNLSILKNGGENFNFQNRSNFQHAEKPFNFQFAKLAILLLGFSICFFTKPANAFAQNSSIIEKAAKTPSVESAISYIQSALPSVKEKAEQIELFIFLGRLQQQSAMYKEAYESYSAAIALDTTVPNAQVRLDAALCSMALGEIETAESVLDTILAAESKDAEYIEATNRAKIYAVWCGALKVQSFNQLERPVTLFQSFLQDEKMAMQRPCLLLSLWWLTGQVEYAEILQKEFPHSTEALVSAGTVQVMALPYWFFVLRSGQNIFAEERLENNSSNEDSKMIYQQVGLYRDEANAQNCMARLRDAGFEPILTKQTKASGNTYAIVLVKETDGTVAQKLRNAGFECYPVFAEDLK